MKSTALSLVGALLLGYLTTSAIAAPIGEQQQQPDDLVDVSQLIEEVKTTAGEAGTASYLLHKYIVSLAFLIHCKSNVRGQDTSHSINQ